MKRTAAHLIIPAALALALTACNAEQEETVYEPAVEDLSGGELEMVDPNAEGVEVDLPETPMTNVPPEEMPEEGAAQEDAVGE